ncbi:MAG: DNA alkylation repair protein [Actinomycetota bacterium]|nr:DNA alkylation repair protein [Actinomycetota bacterium]
MTGSPTRWSAATIAALGPLADADKATPMAAYMKDVAPFLGITAAPRRRAQRAVWAGLPAPDEAQVARTALELWSLPEREFQYAASDLIARHAGRLSTPFLADPIEALLTAKPWWDTVDLLGSAAVTPLVARDPGLVDTMWRWLDSGDRWLVRAAVQHQRGLGGRTDVELLLAMCAHVSDDREFFVAKAVGWALRDASPLAPGLVQRFLDEHPALPTVARREAVRGLARTSRP